MAQFDVMMTVKNDSLLVAKPDVAPIINPAGPLPSGATLSSGAAAVNAVQGVNVPKKELGILTPTGKNLVFVTIMVALILKFGKVGF